MILYVMRHGEAVPESDALQDEWRYLTGKGRVAAEKMSARVARRGPKPRLTITSPLVRAVQTAEIMAENACRKNVVIVSRLLRPGTDPNELIEYLTGLGDGSRVMVVGHEPQLSKLVTELLRPAGCTVSLPKGSCVALRLNPGKPGAASFLWYSDPKTKPVTSLRKAFSGT